MPVSTPRPRILIGGSSERKTLRLVAQYADACNIFGGPDEVAHKLDVLRRHCDAVGVSTVITGSMTDDPGGWLESNFGPAMERLAAIEPAPL